MNTTFRANDKEFDKISEAKAEARRALIGRPEDYSILVYEWVANSTKELSPGYWEPVAKADASRRAAMTKTQAIKVARAAVSKPQPAGKGWQIIGPYHDDQLDGPTTSQPASSYQDGISSRTAWVARVALVTMGWSTIDAEDAVSSYLFRWGSGSIEEIVNSAIAKSGEQSC